MRMGYRSPLLLKRLKIACYVARYYEMVGRLIARESMAWVRITHFETLIQIESEYKDPDTLSNPSGSGKFIEWIDSLEGHLREMRGVQKVPLSSISSEMPLIQVYCQRMRGIIIYLMGQIIHHSRKR